MGDDYHKEPIEHYKPKELKETPSEDNYDYVSGVGGAGGGGSHNHHHSSLGDPSVGGGHKYNQSPLIMGTLLPINTNTIDDTSEYAKHSRDFWVHEGKELVDPYNK